MKNVFVTFIVFAVGLGIGYYLRGAEAGDIQAKQIVGKKTGGESTVHRTDANAAQKPLTQADVTNAIVGVWQSTDDASFTREFLVDSSVIDRYTGGEAATSEGRWAIFTAPQGEPPPFPIPKGTIYLKISDPEEVQYFNIIHISDTDLTLAYFGGKEIQTYTRKK